MVPCRYIRVLVTCAIVVVLSEVAVVHKDVHEHGWDTGPMVQIKRPPSIEGHDHGQQAPAHAVKVSVVA